ncbi:PREDICTED: uncharacterized protein LOC109230615 [Nicotiana attenuata]|uniref:Uncharacterized protein n=1 Tax=Nicotiana attenuata TaxID=49451 RepID=A0A1J6IUJ9_NICAT|nr:PREDICTED: uncharacterized protein LOC109230615 [Nicotiana attenuata]OIT01367.1 hypothetical protein A4A49_10879 [Nicotiana attenuata]
MATPLSSSTVSPTKRMSNEKTKYMEKEEQDHERDNKDQEDSRREHQPPYITPLQPLTKEAYGGGMYGKDDEGGGPARKVDNKPPASETQSADGPEEATLQPKHKPPPSSGDRDIDITGQSYIQ